MKSIKILAVLFYCASCFGQNDAKSAKILDDMTNKFKSYPGLLVDFSATVTQLQDKSESTANGKIWIKGNKSKLELPDQQFFFDGNKIYHYLPDVKEVNIDQPDPEGKDEDLQLFNPQTFFNLSSKNFKSNLAKESTINGRQVYEIDLYPIQIKSSKYSRIRVCVEKNTLQIVFMKVFSKDGTQYAMSFGKYNIQQSLADSMFTFDISKYPGVEVIDLTF